MMKVRFRNTCTVVFVSFLMSLVAGCGLGEENILFVTKTSVGVDVDAKPPTFDIGYARFEGTVAPVFDNGKVLPQMAGFSSDVGLINQAIGQSFATGTAAVVMSKYLTSTAEPDVTGPIDDTAITTPAFVEWSQSKKRYFFATDTSFALRVNFGLETGGIPDSLSLGYKRKEIAFVPLFETASGGNRKTYLPSLLATTGLATDVSRPQTAEVVKTQFFATGDAAGYLAALPGIRAVVAPRIMPESAQIVSAANQQAIQQGIEKAKERSSMISDIVAKVAPGGSLDTAALTALLDAASIDRDDSGRKFLEKATSAENLEKRLEQTRNLVPPLHAAL